MHGITSSNVAFLAEGYTGDVTCGPAGNSSAAAISRLSCGALMALIVVFLVVHVRIVNNLHLGPVLSPPATGSLNVSLLLSPNKTIFDRGDNLEALTCSAQGSPDPTVTLTREGPTSFSTVSLRRQGNRHYIRSSAACRKDIVPLLCPE
ncbi:hypothetical protein RRG08_053704 [Elysia crispata]|uniref:Uncharacterized protein n=1 Tax=Elysia crispata TaxID=231223 RepID=A0AAE1DKK3_9GAST|nr:hypothetical protein RRG08_053704 [Elysia crispata]